MRTWREMAVQDPMAVWSVPLLALIVVAGLVWPLLPIPDPAAVGIGPQIRPPSMAFLLGTDTLGRSLLARVLQGIRTTFLLSTTAVLIAGFIGATLGLISGYIQGVADEVVTRVADVMFSFSLNSPRIAGNSELRTRTSCRHSGHRRVYGTDDDPCRPLRYTHHPELRFRADLGSDRRLFSTTRHSPPPA